MPIAPLPPEASFVGDGTSRVFPLGFYVEFKSQLRVYVNEVEQTTGWSFADGAVTFATAPAAAAQVRIVRQTLPQQVTEFVRATSYASAGVVMTQYLDVDLDRLWMVAQDQARTNTTFADTLASHEQMFGAVETSVLNATAAASTATTAAASAASASTAAAADQTVSTAAAAAAENSATAAAASATTSSGHATAASASASAAAGSAAAVADNAAAVAAAKTAIDGYMPAVQSASGGNRPFATLADLNAYSGGDKSMFVANVMSDSTTTNNGLYRWDGSAWVKSAYDAVTQISMNTSGLNQLNSAFDLGAVKNTFNPALAQDQCLYSLSNGSITTGYAPGLITGRHAVTPGQTYTLSLPSAGGFVWQQYLYCWTAADVYLGLDKPVSSYTVAPIPPTNVVYSDGGETITFTIPSNSTIGKIAMYATMPSHTSGDYSTAVNGIQLEVGSVKTAFLPYNTPSAPVLKSTQLPPGTATTATLVPLQPAIDRASLRVYTSANSVYVRTPWSTTLDLVQAFQTTGDGCNNLLNPNGVKTIPVATADTASVVVSAFANGTVLANQGDDAGPAKYNGSYIGGNHGLAYTQQITVNSHGKTTVDIGSQWTGDGYNWTIMKIVDANNLLVLSDNLGTYGAWMFRNQSLSGKTLTHVSGATNAASMTPSAGVLTQLYPVASKKTLSVLLGGVTAIDPTLTAAYRTEYLDIVETYEIVNAVDLLNYVKARAGSSTVPTYNDASLGTDARVTNLYRVSASGVVCLNAAVTAKNSVALDYLGLSQMAAPVWSGKNIDLYVNRCQTITVGSNTYNPQALADLTTASDPLSILTANWVDPANPPTRMAYVVRSGSSREFVSVIGYESLRGSVKPAIRKTGVNDAALVNGRSKLYPKAATGSAYGGGIFPAGAVVSGVVYRAYANCSNLPPATVCFWYRGADHAHYVVIDFHQSITALAVPLPSWMVGRSAEIIETSGSITLLSDLVGVDGVVVSAVNYGGAVIRVT